MDSVQIEAQLAIECCARLAPEERLAIELRSVEDLNQYEVATRLGISQMQVSRVLRRGLAELLAAVQGDELPEGRRTYTEAGHDPRFPYGRKRRRRKRAEVAA